MIVSQLQLSLATIGKLNIPYKYARYAVCVSTISKKPSNLLPVRPSQAAVPPELQPLQRQDVQALGKLLPQAEAAVLSADGPAIEQPRENE